ncbi:MAG: hypothetical protein JXA42_16205 [Anaerolineales bacterium]|nr:hypothetical protein [Anaerolineales bacterium]
MEKAELYPIKQEDDDLFDRIVSILEQAWANVVRSINNNMVIAYWLIGREIVQEIQGGEERAEYGKQVIDQLSAKLARKYGRGFSTTNLRYFRTFYTVYSDRIPEIRHIACGEFKTSEKRHTQSGVLDTMLLAVEQDSIKRGFSLKQFYLTFPNIQKSYALRSELTWTHYCLIMRVDNQSARDWYNTGL